MYSPSNEIRDREMDRTEIKSGGDVILGGCDAV
jgi:hypothetical protein